MREQYYLEKLTTMPEIQGAWGVKNGSDATKPIISNTMPVSILAVFLISIAYLIALCAMCGSVQWSIRLTK